MFGLLLLLSKISKIAKRLLRAYEVSAGDILRPTTRFSHVLATTVVTL